MTRALLEQALAVLELSTSIKLTRATLLDREVVIDAIRAELDKPERQPVHDHGCSTHYHARAKCDCTLSKSEQPELAKPPTQPAWRDAPTGPGLWVNSISGRVNVVIEETLSAWQNTGARWFGPLPEDKP